MRPETRHFKLTIAYDGTAYGGWQMQPNRVSVQSLIEGALAKLAGGRVVLHGSGRTDAGVHACAQIASFTAALPHTTTTILRALNANLPEAGRPTRGASKSPPLRSRT